MASILKKGERWRAEVFRQGVRKAKTFDTKTEAKNWAARQEYLILNEEVVQGKITFGEVLERYAREVSPAKRGARWEQIRIEAFLTYPIAKIPVAALKPVDLGSWREARLREVSSSTVKREMVLMSAVLTQARKEWGLIKDNPMADVRKPSDAAPRDRRPTPEEMEKLSLNFGNNLGDVTGRVWQAFLFAIETGMRASEIAGMTWDRTDLEKKIVRLPITKNGSAREVALSSEAVRILESLPRQDSPPGSVWGMTTVQMDALWRKVNKRAGVENLHFHDSRHEAVSRLAKKLDVLSLARMIGHKDLRQLQTYYNETAEELAKRLGQATSSKVCGVFRPLIGDALGDTLGLGSTGLRL
jgi:integrase